MKLHSSILALSLLLAAVPVAAADLGSDTIPTSGGDLVITFIGHGSLRFELGETVVYIDPWSRLADFSQMPKMNLPYTMTPEMVADAARAFRPRILYPYHFGQTDPALLVTLLAAETDIEVRIRELE